MVTHIVFFKLGDPTRENILELKNKLLSMSGKVPQLRYLETGVDIVRSERSYDLALITKFDSLEDMREYQVHPYHAEEILPHVRRVSESVVAVDYESEK
jgi:hypothetical protein